MNIRTGDVHLTIVQGGAGKEAAPVETIEAPKLPAIDRFPGIVDGYLNVEPWEAAVYVERLEGFLGREVGEDEADALVSYVSSVRIDNENLLKVLCGKRVLLPTPDTKTGILGNESEFVTLGEHDVDHWREEYETGLAVARRVRSA